MAHLLEEGGRTHTLCYKRRSSHLLACFQQFTYTSVLVPQMKETVSKQVTPALFVSFRRTAFRAKPPAVQNIRSIYAEHDYFWRAPE